MIAPYISTSRWSDAFQVPNLIRPVGSVWYVVTISTSLAIVNVVQVFSVSGRLILFQHRSITGRPVNDSFPKGLWYGYQPDNHHLRRELRLCEWAQPQACSNCWPDFSSQFCRLSISRVIMHSLWSLSPKFVTPDVRGYFPCHFFNDRHGMLIGTWTSDGP